MPSAHERPDGKGLSGASLLLEIGDDPLRDGIGVPLTSVGRLHLGGVVNVAHKADLDEHRGVLDKVGSRQIRKTVKTVRPDIARRLSGS